MRNHIIVIFFSFILTQNIEILDIKVEGTERLKEEDIYRISKLYPGMYLSRGDEINKGINKLWAVGRFADIQFYLDDENEKGIVLKIILNELPVIGTIKYVGNKKKRDKTLDDLVELASGQILSNNELFNAQKMIIEKYRDDRFYNISVTHKIEDTDVDYIKNLIFYIDEGRKSRIRKINIRGNNNFPFYSLINKNQLSKVFKNNREYKWYAPWRGKFSENGFEEDIKNLEIFYKNQGYRDFKVLSKNILYLNRKIELDLDIYEGKNISIKNLIS